MTTAMTDEELVAVLKRHIDVIERAVQDWYGDRPITESIVEAIERAIEVLSPCPECGGVLTVHVCFTSTWPKDDADFIRGLSGVPWPGTAAESNAAVRESMDWGDSDD